MVSVAPSIELIKYQRRRPEQGLLYRTVETYWPLFLREQEKVGRSLPHFIKDEFKEFLHCGIPEFGFVRTYCDQCRISGIVAFSCKRRGFCPSCCARRMNDEAGHLLDQVLPEAACYRQWVLSFPYRLRFLMAHDSKLTTQLLSIFIQVISSDQRRRAKRLGVKNSKPGSVTFIQRFGSALNLNVHFHALFADGVFYKTEEGEYQFLKLPEPEAHDLSALVEKIQHKVLRCIAKLKLDEQEHFEFDESSLSEVSSNSICHRSSYGERQGQSLRRYGVKRIEVDPEDEDPFSARRGGFSLNARVWISGKSREKLEKLIRYMARGPVATERLSESFPNMLIYKMKTPWRDGTTHVSFSHLDFIARLVALIPPPKMNLVRYHGVFAPNFKDRSLIVPAPKARSTRVHPDAKDSAFKQGKMRRERMKWSEMLKRTFKVDVTVCVRCQGRVEQIAVIKDRVVARAILESMRDATVFRPLEVMEDRGPPNEGMPAFDEYDPRESW